MFDFLKRNLFFQNKVITTNLLASLILNLAILLVIYFSIYPRTEPIALRYNIFFGIDLIGPWWYAFAFPLVAFIIFIVNFFLSYNVYLKEKLISLFLVLTSTAAQILILFHAILVSLLNK